MNSRTQKASDHQQTITLLRELLNEAESGAIDGIAVVAITRDHQGHLSDAAGSAVRFVAHTLGALKLLGDDLSAACRRPLTETPDSGN